MAVYVNLYLHGKPGLQFYVFQTKFSIHEAEANEQAFPSGWQYTAPPLLDLKEQVRQGSTAE